MSHPPAPVRLALLLCALGAGPVWGRQESAMVERAEREATFARLMSGAKLVGSFTASDAPPGSAPQSDGYTLGAVSKVEGSESSWRFEASLAYGESRFPMALVVEVLWAGDTPVITVEDMAIPFMGSFEARVVIHDDQYAGTWSGAGHSGQLFGVIERARASGAGEGHWPSFRGRGASGISEGAALPVRWDVESGAGVAWRTPIPGLAHSSPVIFGERIFLTTAVREAGEAELKVGLYGDIAPVDDESPHTFAVVCVDRSSGEVLWERAAFEGVPTDRRHPKGSHAASTPTTDGERVVALFGSEGLFCYSAEGELLWQRDLGELNAGFYRLPGAEWGFGSSPVIHERLVLVQADIQGDSFLAALDIETGEDVWRTPRDEFPGWGSPTVVVTESRSQVVVNGFKHIGGYDLASGAQLWKLVGGGDLPTPTPIFAQGLVFITNAHGRFAPILAIDPAASGELAMKAEESEYMVWSRMRRGNYMQTPLVHGDGLYLCSDAGILACYDARSGEERFRERLGSGGTGFTASAVAGDGKLYLTSEQGEVFVVRAGAQIDLLAVNSLGEECMATPAIAEGVVFWRTRRHLVAIDGAVDDAGK
ncbi:MAG: PQQ-binding-like beta-propeller repeat protein [Planctomycetota bacterium]|nr:PQQ-binding-like beta-propeller repeat protein [Planctomycetota bacterium]